MQKVNLFKFLKEFNEIRNPIIRDINTYSFKLSTGEIKPNEYIDLFTESEDSNQEVLVVRQPKKDRCPSLPEDLRLWIEDGWDSYKVKNINVRPEISRLNRSDDDSTEKFEDDHSRVSSFKVWNENRIKWQLQEEKKEQANQLYQKLFSLQSDINKEAESLELVIGDGILYWKHDSNDYHHPLISQVVKLDFDASIPKFTVSIEEPKIELNTAILRTMSSLDQKMIYELTDTIEEIGSFFDLEFNRERFKSMISMIHSEGSFENGPIINSKNPIIYSNPIIYLRKKTLGFSEFISSIIEYIDEDQSVELPDFFENLLGNYRETPPTSYTKTWNQSGLDKEVLLTLPANNEQLGIIQKLNQYPAVLVQGPPGTGKTHTIANLIGHLLSEGKNILVTSHTEKALSVLKKKVHKDLQNLCISVLSSSSQRSEMEAAINEINDKRSSFDEISSNNKIKKLESHREFLIESYKDKLAELTRVRSSEYLDLIFNNESISPIDAAKFVGNGIGEIDYIPGESVNDQVTLPISEFELKELYESNESLSSEVEVLLKQSWPELTSIWTPDSFTEHINTVTELEKLVEQENVTNPLVVEHIELIRQSKKCLDDLLLITHELDDDVHAILSDFHKSEVQRTNWKDILEDSKYLLENHKEYLEIMSSYDISMEDEYLNLRGLELLNEILLSGKEYPVKGLFFVNKNWKALATSIMIDGRSLEKLTDFITFKKILSYELLLKKISKKIMMQFNGISYESESTTLSSTKVTELLEKLNRNIEKIEDKFNECRDLVGKLNFLIGQVEYKADIKRYLTDSILQVTKLLNEFDLNQEINEIAAYSNYIGKFTKENKILSEIHRSITNRNAESYATNYEEIQEIVAKVELVEKRNRLLKSLEQVAPDWSVAIKNRNGIHGEFTAPARIRDAWKWFQLNHQIRRLSAIDASGIQNSISDLYHQILRNSQELALEKAWNLKISKITSEQTAAISGWKQTLNQIGKGTGKRAARLRHEAKKLMARCQTAIPVWIMPLNQVANNFNPKINKFDVVIIDEASQADMLALPTLFLGKKVIVVGDDQQVSPDGVGQSIDNMDALIRQYLKDVPNHHLFTEKLSIYDLASNANFSQVVLKEHFRCLPEIIQFSNELAYSNNIQPLRDSSGVTITPALVEHRVDGGQKGNNNTNRSEAENIVALIKAMIKNSAYDNQTIGVISMLGDEQAKMIDIMIQNAIPAEEYNKRKILCGNPPQFQGDERDVIFLSLIDTPNLAGGPVRLNDSDSRNGMYKKRYNVAVSRAKNQLWVVHSLNPNMDLKPDDIRHRLINHVRNFKMEEKVIGRAESPFEKEVITALLSKGYKVIPQLIVGSYRLDMVVISGTKKIAIECDGERYHTPDNLEDDMNRQAILERCGWRFIRIRGSKYYSNKSGTLKELFEELEQKEIYPVMSDEANLNEVSDTASEVKRVAASILNNKTIDFLEEKIEEIYTDDPHSKPNTINPASPDEVENGPINKPLSTEKVQRPLFDFTKMN